LCKEEEKAWCCPLTYKLSVDKLIQDRFCRNTEKIKCKEPTASKYYPLYKTYRQISTRCKNLLTLTAKANPITVSGTFNPCFLTLKIPPFLYKNSA
jgi:hypothetical protein